VNFNLTNSANSNDYFEFDQVVDSLNEKIKGQYSVQKAWSRTGTGPSTKADCTNTGSNQNIQICHPISDYYSGTDDIVKYAKVIAGSYTLVAKAYSDNTSPLSLKKALSNLKYAYDLYLGSYTAVLEFLQEKIKTFMDQIREYATPGNSFSFLNGHFILTNLKILLKYLSLFT